MQDVKPRHIRWILDRRNSDNVKWRNQFIRWHVRYMTFKDTSASQSYRDRLRNAMNWNAEDLEAEFTRARAAMQSL